MEGCPTSPPPPPQPLPPPPPPPNAGSRSAVPTVHGRHRSAGCGSGYFADCASCLVASRPHWLPPMRRSTGGLLVGPVEVRMGGGEPGGGARWRWRSVTWAAARRPCGGLRGPCDAGRMCLVGAACAARQGKDGRRRRQAGRRQGGGGRRRGGRPRCRRKAVALDTARPLGTVAPQNETGRWLMQAAAWGPLQRGGALPRRLVSASQTGARDRQSVFLHHLLQQFEHYA